MLEVITEQLAIASGSVSVSAPASAEQGDRVSVSVKVTNTLGYHSSFETEIFAGVTRILSKSEIILDGDSKTYSASFTMPADDITVLAWVERWVFDHWAYYGSDSESVALYTPPPPPPPPVPPPCSIFIAAPSSAEEGERVQLSARITNNSPNAELYKIEMYAGADLIGRITDTIPGGSSETYGGSFTMPAGDITILVWVEVSYLGEWRYSNSASRTVTLAPEVAWVQLAQEQLTIAIPEVIAWVVLAEEEITITIPEVIAWVQLAEEQISIGVPEVIGWVVLAEKQIDIGAPEVVAWVTLAEEEIAINLTVPVEEYELVQHTIYPWAYTFEGDAETCVFEFKLTPEQIPGTEWLGQVIVNSFVSELEKKGARLLELKVERDTTPVWWTNYRVEVTATASPLAWNLIIIGVLAILFIIAIYFTIKLVDEVFFKRKALDEETKKTFSRETLTAMILDLEPETPSETLEEMSDQELRDLLNQILAEKAPPIDLAALAIVGGLGILGIGAVLALTARRKE